MTPELRREALTKVMDLLDAHYVFPEVAAAIRRKLEGRMAEGAYDGAETTEAFCQAVTDDLQAVSHDKHVRLRRRDPSRSLGGPGAGDRADFQLRRQHQNHAFAKVERLEGNVGYLDLRGFEHPGTAAGQTAVAAMQFLANSSAVIFDLRKCPGGSPGMVSLLISYLVGEWPEHLNTFYNRDGEAAFQNWTMSWVPGRRLTDVPVYVLTSDYTFSAAEEFTYNLKNMKRATIVGEKTGGGANPGGNRPVVEDLELFVPEGRAYNPITKDNWEGKGIEPDIAVPAEQALNAAYAEALKKVAENARTQQGGAWEALAQEAEGALAKLGR
ncbi:MAG: peptidase [Symbiobacteriaceae bacterium]|jgi:C-terminal processing protease CtpA/Prc|nr:peptidase [Symbiobacteriaceae bacterium]